MKYPKAQHGKKIAGHKAAATLSDKPGGSGWPLLRFDGGVSGNGRADAVGRWAFTLDDRGRLASGSGEATGSPVTVNTCEWEGLYDGLLAVLSSAPAAHWCGRRSPVTCRSAVLTLYGWAQCSSTTGPARRAVAGPVIAKPSTGAPTAWRVTSFAKGS